MSTVSSESPEQVRLTADPRVSAYDRLSAWLTSGVVILGTLVAAMFLIWLTMVIDFGREPANVVMFEEPFGNDNHPEGIAEDWKPPGVEEFPEVDEPQLSDALEQMTDAVSTVKSSLETVDGNAMKMGRGTGYGDKREKGPGGGRGNIIPEWDRWKIEISAASPGEYMSILEYFGITLGAVSQASNLIEYVDNLTGAPVVTQGQRGQEKRLFFMNPRNRLRRWDENKAQASGIDLEYKLVGHFYPDEVRARLREMEQAVYKRENKSLEEVRRTRFRIRPSGSGFEYYVESIEYRPKPQGNQQRGLL